MSFDGIMTRAIVHELSEQLIGGRITKIYQPNEHDILLLIRSHNQNLKLLISANPAFSRIHLSEETFTNPLDPPMFCMLLRKYCDGGIIERITQIGLERVVHIDIKSHDELGDLKVKRLIVEIMGRHSNIILIDPAKNLILDGIHHVTPAVSQYRTVLPGREYISPPEQGKLDPLVVNEDKFTAVLDLNQGKLDKQLVDRFSGLSPQVAREILHRSGLATRNRLWRSFFEVMEEINGHRYFPQTVVTAEKSFFSVIPLTHITDGLNPARVAIQPFQSVSHMLEAHFRGKTERDITVQQTNDLTRLVSGEISKLHKKLSKLQQAINDAKQAETWMRYGELITAYMHLIQRGDREVTVENFYEEDTPSISIPLDSTKTPAENAQHYFKKYNKAKTAAVAAEEQAAIANLEIEYLDGILQQLAFAEAKDVEEIREELAEQGYLRLRSRVRIRSNGKKGDRRSVRRTPTLERFLSSEGKEILVGKNNTQNEYLTRKLAAAQDTWLHTKDIPGSHVVIRATEFGEATLREAAMLAAFFSKARFSSQVPVDYTLIKHVKKPGGAKPGYVIYENQKTVYVSPEEELVARLRGASTGNAGG